MKLKRDYTGNIIDEDSNIALRVGTWNQCSSDVPGALEAYIPFHCFVAADRDIEAVRQAALSAEVVFSFNIVNDLYIDNPQYVELHVAAIPGLGSPHAVAVFRGGMIRMGVGRERGYKRVLDKHESELQEALCVLESAGRLWEASDSEESTSALIRGAGYAVVFSEYD